MASVTLAESAKLAQDELVAGVIENVITVNRMFDILPFDGIDGNSLAYNRENALGGAGVSGVGTVISTGAVDPISGANNAKDAATFTSVNANLTRIIADAEVDNLIQVTRSGDGNDQRATQVGSKAKKVGRIYQHMLINGSGAGNQFNGLINLVAAGQTRTAAPNGEALSFAILDFLLRTVVDKDGQVDYLTMHGRTLDSYLELLRGLGGAGIGETVTLPSQAEVPAYRGVPILRNDFVPIDQTQGTETAATTVFAGTLDDGSRSHGIAGITAEQAAGIQVREVGEAEDKDESITRVVWYCGLALFSEKGLAAAPGINN